MTGDWELRHCSICGALETDPTIAIVFDWATGEVVHLADGGIERCGVLVPVTEVTS